MNDPEAMLRNAEHVAGLLRRHRIDAVVIGAVALAAYHYPSLLHSPFTIFSVLAHKLISCFKLTCP